MTLSFEDTRRAAPDEPTDEALRDLVGLVDHDVTTDPFPVLGMDAVVFVCGNATQSAQYAGPVGTLGVRLDAVHQPVTGFDALDIE